MRSTISHGISIGIERIQWDFFLCLKASGYLSHTDYEMLAPLIDGALRGVAHPQVNVLLDATDFLGWEQYTAWEDFMLELGYRNQFSRIAILGRSNWRLITSGIASWFASGEARYFEDRDAALKWLSWPVVVSRPA
ncbi:STAS/SEC14 domain-containing protein [Microbulbifer rhizosphaerae]|uniref:SpoIIAA-like n=1 Tax=Microbulbifer rhizosphaerae TaxID=1562603 RepID=A0A7W4W9E5_9GAMM|nr:STAS/SEC14 domain-containing protein [Microbulbifer rhizosphaerae]MBB3060125.1 hypothetical protein [Microbulbifer rhizosphaerae]